MTLYQYDASTEKRTAVVADFGGTGHLNLRTSFAYDGVGNVTAVTDPKGNVTRNTYDLDRRLITSTAPGTPAAPGGIVTLFTYDMNK